MCSDANIEQSQGREQPWLGETKQDILDRMCDQLGIPREPIGVGSSVPSTFFDAVRIRFGVPKGTMPEIAEEVVHRAGGHWAPEFDSRGSLSGGGSTVTALGLQALERAIASLL
jgi:hypothetical protein